MSAFTTLSQTLASTLTAASSVISSTASVVTLGAEVAAKGLARLDNVTDLALARDKAFREVELDSIALQAVQAKEQAQLDAKKAKLETASELKKLEKKAQDQGIDLTLPDDEELSKLRTKLGISKKTK